MNLEEKEPGFLYLKKLVLADFGISTVMKNSTNSKTQSKKDGLPGTPGYMAPEFKNLNQYFHI